METQGYYQLNHKPAPDALAGCSDFDPWMIEDFSESYDKGQLGRAIDSFTYLDDLPESYPGIGNARIVLAAALAVHDGMADEPTLPAPTPAPPPTRRVTVWDTHWTDTNPGYDNARNPQSCPHFHYDKATTQRDYLNSKYPKAFAYVEGPRTMTVAA